MAAPEPLPAASQGMTLAELGRLAECNNPTLAQAAARVEAARALWLQAGLYPNPRAGYQASEINDEKQAGQQGAFFGQEFVTAGKLKLSQAAAHRAIEQAQCAWAAQRGRVENDVRRAFYDVLVAQRTIELSDQLVRVGREGVRAAEELFKAKEVGRVDILQARIEADSAGIISQKARNRHWAAWRNLAAVVGVADMPPQPLAGEMQDGLPQLTWEESLDRVLGESPLLAEARAGVARADAVLRRRMRRADAERRRSGGGAVRQRHPRRNRRRAGRNAPARFQSQPGEHP